MRIKRDYLIAIKRQWEWIISRFKPLTVHTEAIMVDSVWEEIKKKVKNREVKIWYIMTPVNYNYFKSSFNVKLPKKKLSRIMKQRYKWMLEKGARLELHVHLSMVMKNIRVKEQGKLIKDSLSWMKKELGLSAREFVPGWWSYNEETLKICDRLGLRMIHPKDYDFTHDFHWIL